MEKKKFKNVEKKSEEAKTKQGKEENEIVPSLNHNGEDYEKAHTHTHTHTHLSICCAAEMNTTL